jgi:hypothetical protein
MLNPRVRKLENKLARYAILADAAEQANNTKMVRFYDQKFAGCASTILQLEK